MNTSLLRNECFRLRCPQALLSIRRQVIRPRKQFEFIGFSVTVEIEKPLFTSLNVRVETGLVRNGRDLARRVAKEDFIWYQFQTLVCVSNLDHRLNRPGKHTCVVLGPTYPSSSAVDSTVKACDLLAVVLACLHDLGGDRWHHAGNR